MVAVGEWVAARSRLEKGRTRASGWEPVLWGLTLIGVALRIRQYGYRRSLWGDEASVALNITHRGFVDLTRPLNVLQGAPFGWLWLERLCFLVLGNGEYQLRLPALLAGILLMWWARLLVRRRLSGMAAAVVLVLVAVSPSLVYYSSEVKPYGWDAAVSVGLLLVASSVDLMTWRGAGLFAASGAAGVMFSFPALYVVAAVVATAAARALRRRDWRLLSWHLGGGAVSLGLFGFQYVRALRPTAGNQALKQFWSVGYPPHGLALSAFMGWVWHQGYAVGRYPLDASVPVLALLLLAAGLTVLARSGRQTLAAQVLIVLALLLAGSVLRVYPVADRMVLFAVALVILAAGSSIDGSDSRACRLLMAGLVMVAWAGTIPRAVEAVVHPYKRTEIREALVYAERHRTPGDQIWLEDWGNSVYQYYSPLLHVTVQAEFELGPTGCEQRPAQMEGLRPGHHLWVVFATPPGIPLHIGGYLSALGAVGRLDLWHGTSAGAGTAEYTVGPTVPPQVRSPLGCLLFSPAVRLQR